MKGKTNTTIIIPNYNGVPYLDACLQSVKADSETPVIVVDDGSTDGSAEYLAAHYPEVEVIALPQNKGFCHAVNTGIKRAATPYVILLNNDTVVRPGFADALQTAIAKDRRIFSVAAKMLDMKKPSHIDGAGDLYTALGWAYARGKGKHSACYEKEAEVFSACAGAAIYRRRVLERLGYFDEAHFAYLEDVDLGYAARLRGYRNRYCPKAEALHIGSAAFGSRYNAAKTALAARNSVYVIAKNMPPGQIVWNLPLLLLGFFIKFLFFCRKGLGFPYLRGLVDGFALSRAPAARARRVRFQRKHLKHYLRVQAELYVNIVRLIKAI
ncbi:MAG: glycosyltransferase family 2 protein [Lachnospiraceae bacterium]|nr:glycosyltransferase family 2 protein [Lachnospiraceae bacterium]